MSALNILEHPVLNEMLHDGRNIRIMEDYWYRDWRGLMWYVNKGAVVNGADKPSILWSVSGGPYIGKERIASIPHDVYCVSRERTAEETHNMFWCLMMDLGCEKGRADRRWCAVDLFGPDWDEKPERQKSALQLDFIRSVEEDWSLA